MVRPPSSVRTFLIISADVGERSAKLGGEISAHFRIGGRSIWSQVPLRVYLWGGLALVCFGLSFLYPSGSSYRITSADISAVVARDGSMQVDEAFTYRFNGDYHGVYRDIPVEGDKVVTVTGVAGPYGDMNRLPDDTSEPAPGASPAYGPPDTYRLSRHGGDLRITVYEPESDTDATFVYSYVVSNAAERYLDTSELYWKCIGPEWQVPMDDVHVYVSLPGRVAPDAIRAWAHGPLNGTVGIDHTGLVSLAVKDLPARTFVATRILFPRASLSKVAVVGTREVPSVLTAEAASASQANAERAAAVDNRRNHRTLRHVALIVIPIAVLIGLAIWTVLFLRYGREHHPGFSGRYFRDIPADLPPAVVGSLWRMGVTKDNDLTATLLDLARRGVIDIRRRGSMLDDNNPDLRLTLRNDAAARHPRGNAGSTAAASTGDANSSTATATATATASPAAVAGAHEPALTAIDAQLLDLLFDTVGKGDTVTLSDLKDWVKDNRTEFRDALNAWAQAVNDEAGRQGLLEARGQKAKRQALWLGAAVFVFSALVGAVATAWPAAAAGCAAGGFMMATCGVMKRRTPAAATLHAKYKGLYNYMTDFGQMQEKPPEAVVLWESYLVLAVVFGIADKAGEQLRVRVPQVVDDPAFRGTFGWAFASPGGFSGPSLAAFGASLNTAVAASMPASAGGHGGGFGGGFGGGGFGGGGGGAF